MRCGNKPLFGLSKPSPLPTTNHSMMTTDVCDWCISSEFHKRTILSPFPSSSLFCFLLCGASFTTTQRLKSPTLPSWLQIKLLTSVSFLIKRPKILMALPPPQSGTLKTIYMVI